ncbi:MAG: hypothetical protein GC159_21155 [Phycisphaera sp.]|nr:hypothetical protein [Phycisphaera sp.]
MKRYARGFTVVELLVVVSIIILLISVLMPSFERAQYDTKKVVCSSNYHQWGVATLNYANDFERALPRFDYGSSGLNTWDVGNGFTQSMMDYGVHWKQFFCPLSWQDGWHRTNWWGVGHVAPKNDAETLQFFHKLTPNFELIRYDWWVPRHASGKMFPFVAPYYTDAMAASDGFPVSVADRRAAFRPILTDQIGSRGPASTDPTSSTVTGGHQWKGRLESTNLLYVDGHVDQHQLDQIEHRYSGNWGNFY